MAKVMKDIIIITLLIIIVFMVFTGYALHKLSMRIDAIDKPNPPVPDHMQTVQFDVAGKEQDQYILRLEYVFWDREAADRGKEKMKKLWEGK
jgi:uncharacterized protein YxeA